jgi:hypothetical protein
MKKINALIPKLYYEDYRDKFYNYKARFVKCTLLALLLNLALWLWRLQIQDNHQSKTQMSEDKKNQSQ